MEQLEQRALLAVTATLSGSDLQISLGADDDVAYLSNDGTNYIVRGTGLSGYAAANASVSSVSVAGTAAGNQSFTVAAGVRAVLTDPLSVAASVENTTVVGAIDTLGTVTIRSGAITLAADVTTTGKQDYQGDVGLVGTRTLSAGVGNVQFGGKVDSSAQLFADPDAFADGTTLTTSFPGITLSVAGSYTAVTSGSSYVSTPTTGYYAPTGNQVFGPYDWNAPYTVLKAAFANPVTSVSLDFAPNDSYDPNAYLEAYDAAGNKLASATYPPAIAELSFVTLTVSASNIAYVLASFDPGGGNTGVLDNLRATLATAPAASLTVNSTGTTTFARAVGGTAALASLSTDAGGTTAINGGSITTTGAAGQAYNDAVTLRQNAVLDAGIGDVLFATTVDRGTSAIDGPAGYFVDTSPGTAAPPSTLGGYTMSAFGQTSAVVDGTPVSSITESGSTLTFDQSVMKATIGSGWATWSHGYAKAVYTTTGSTHPLSLTMTLPAGTDAVYFYVEPNSFGAYDVTATYAGGTPAATVSADGSSGAKYFGFYSSSGDSLVSITITAVSGTGGFAVGEFGISVGAAAPSLVVNAAGTTTFGGTVGGSVPLGSVTTDALGTTLVAGGVITTVNNQTYNDAVVTIDTVVPTITITSDKPALKAGETAAITFTLSEAATNFGEDDVAVSGGTLLNFTGSGASYTATFTPTAASTSPGSVSVAASKFTDAAGNPNTASNTVSLTIDTAVPTIAISSDKSALKAGETATIAFTLSESATDFTSDDVTVSGGMLSNFAGSGASYTATFTPTAASTSPGSISVAASTFTDSAGNPNRASNTLSLTIDTVVPTIAITSDKSALKAGETATITFTLSELATDFTSSDVTVSGGTLSNFTGSGTSYTATFTPTAASTAAGSVSVAASTFTDPAGNPNTASNTLSLAIDTVVPTIAIMSDKSALKAGETATITFTLSELATDFTSSDVTVSGGTLSNFTGFGATYTARFMPTVASTTAGSISVAVSKFTDAAGNPNTASSALTLSIDTVDFVATFATVPALTNQPLQTIQVTFNKSVRQISVADFRLLRNGQPQSLAGASITGSGTTWTLGGLSSITQTSGSYALGLQPSAAIEDFAGNRVRTDASRNWVCMPAVTFEAIPATVTSSIGSLTLRFNGNVTGFDKSQIRLTVNGREVSLRTATLTGSGSNFRLSGLDKLTGANARYSITIGGRGSTITNSSGTAMTTAMTVAWSKQPARSR